MTANERSAVTKKLRALNTRVISIWPYEWKYKKYQVLNFLNSAMNKNNIIYARKCKFDIIPSNIARDFCKKHHIQGASNCKLALGVYWNDELVGVATFAKHHRNVDEILLNRLCFKDGVNVVGALSKFSKMACFILDQPIYTFTHNTLSDGAGYIKAGWEKVKDVPKDYFFMKGNKMLTKQSQKYRSQIDLTRVFDAGKQKFKHSP